jgi:Flp pilus assembly protein TadD
MINRSPQLRNLLSSVIYAWALATWLGCISVALSVVLVGESHANALMWAAANEELSTHTWSESEIERVLTEGQVESLEALALSAWNAEQWLISGRAAQRWRELTGQSRLMVQEFVGFAESQRADEAVAVLVQMAQSTDADVAGWAELAQSLSMFSDAERQLALWEQLTQMPEAEPHQLALMMARSKLHYLQEDVDEALRWVLRVVAQAPTPEVVEWAIDLATASDLPDKGLVDLEYLAPSDKNAARFALWRASILQQLDLPEQALKVLIEGEATVELLYFRGGFAWALNEQDVINNSWDLLLQQSKQSQFNSEESYYAAHLAELFGYYGQAWTWFELVDDAPWLYEALIAKARMLNSMVDREAWSDMSGSLEDVRAGLARVRLEGNKSLSDRAWALEAALMRRANRQQEFLEMLHESLESAGTDGDLLYLRAIEAMDLGQLGLAEQDLRRMIQIDRQDARALNALGYLLADKTPRLSEAFVLIDEALRLSPESPEIIDSMGWVNYRLGRLDEAVYYLEWAYALSDDPEIRGHFIEVLEAIGDQSRLSGVLANESEQPSGSRQSLSAKTPP